MMGHPPPLPLETASLALRALAPGDAAKLFRMSQEEGMRAWLPSQVYRDEEHAAAVLNMLMACFRTPGDPRSGPWVLGVQLKRENELIGHVGFSPWDNDVEVGFAIEKAHQRKGFAVEAVRAACTWVVASFGITRILGVTALENSGSQGVLVKSGFARQREELLSFQGREQPVVIYSYPDPRE